MNTQEQSYSFLDYIQEAIRTESIVPLVAQPYSTEVRLIESRLLHSAIGLSTEAGELLDALKKNIFYAKPLDLVNVEEEAGDLLWYLAILFDALKLNPYDVMRKNIAKLKARYPQKFESEQAITRDLAAERKILESKPTEEEVDAFINGRFSPVSEPNDK